MEWTSEARQALHEHVSKSTQQAPTSEIYHDLFTDLTAHVEEEMHQKGQSKIDTSSLKIILTSIGSDEFVELQHDATPNPPHHPSHLNHPPNPEATKYFDPTGKNTTQFPQPQNYPTKNNICQVTAFRTFCTWLFTIILPTITLGAELVNHESRSLFFDPIPTWFHVVFIAMVPVTFLATYLYRVKLDKVATGSLIDFQNTKILRAMHGFVLPVIVYYMLLFLPITPIAAIGCIVLLGFLPLAPLICFIAWFQANAGVENSVDVRHQPESGKWLKYGLFSGVVCLVALEAPSYLAQKALTDATSADLKTSQRGIDNIRLFGGEDTLLHLCYHGESRTQVFSGMLGSSPAHWVHNQLFTRNISSEQARTLYYKVTGVPFNTVKPPASSNRNEATFTDWSWDEDHGGDAVAAKTRGLSLQSSRMDMHIDDETRLGYVEWIIEFKNRRPTSKEARMQIALPHKGFVSKLTLWVNGEERPAAFSSVSKVKSAYKAIAVEQRRDPVLVNVSGADRVMLQCFPVPPNDGLMKMKVGITFPLSCSETNSGNIHFPYIAERNFSISEELKHEIYAQGNLQINAPKASIDQSGNLKTLQYALTNPSLKTERITWKDLTPNHHSKLYTIDPFHRGADTYLIRQLSKNSALLETTPNTVIVIVDGSASMHRWKPMIAKLIDEKNASLKIYITGNEQQPLIPCDSGKQLMDTDFVGGIDNIPALREALTKAKKNKQNPASILWIHGAQPVKFPSIAGLEQDLERLSTPVPIYDVALEDGANKVLEALKGCEHFKGGCRVVNETDLIHMAEKISQPQPETRYTWTRSETPPADSIRAWDQLARKWAYETTLEHLNDNNYSYLAAQYQLVTPLSGAVVLETQQQYHDTGLEVPDGENLAHLPVTPEPSSSLLLLLGAFMMTIRRNRGE